MTQSINPEYEMFAVLVANGSTMREAASLAGFAEGYCTQLAQRPEVRARIEHLLELQSKEAEVFGGIASRAWIEAQLVIIARKAMQESPARISDDGKESQPARPADYDLARRTLMDLAKLKGMVIERKQVAKANINLGGQGASLEGHVSAYLDALDPAARKDIEDRVKQLESRGQKKRKQLPPAITVEARTIGVSAESEQADE